MSLRGGRQADEAIPPSRLAGDASPGGASAPTLAMTLSHVLARRPPGRRSNPPLAGEACPCEEAARPTKQSPLSPGRHVFARRPPGRRINPPLSPGRYVFARRPPGRRINPPSRRAGMSLRAGRQADESIPPSRRAGDCFATLLRNSTPFLSERRAPRRCGATPKKLHSVSFGKKGASALWSYSQRH